MTNEVEQFTQWLGTRKLYTVDHEHHLDGSDLPVITKPNWSLVHHNADGSPSQGIGILETSPDCHTGRFTAERLGTVTVTIVASASPTAVASTTFKINVLPHPPIAGARSTLKVRQFRNGPIHS